MTRALDRRGRREPEGPARGEPEQKPGAPSEPDAPDDVETKIDEAVTESFPASDPPAWTPGVV